MKISAKIASGLHHQEVVVQTNDAAKNLVIPAKPSGLGTDRVAEVHNTLRKGLEVKLVR